jgi:transcriptional regulator of acetoin/glycerol metabolism
VSASATHGARAFLDIVPGLREARWNKKLAAQLLGIHRRTLYRLTKRYGISLSEREHDGA